MKKILALIIFAFTTSTVNCFAGKCENATTVTTVPIHSVVFTVMGREFRSDISIRLSGKIGNETISFDAFRPGESFTAIPKATHVKRVEKSVCGPSTMYATKTTVSYELIK